MHRPRIFFRRAACCEISSDKEHRIFALAVMPAKQIGCVVSERTQILLGALNSLLHLADIDGMLLFFTFKTSMV